MDATDTTKLQMYQFNMSIKVRFREDRMPGKLVRVSFFIGRLSFCFSVASLKCQKAGMDLGPYVYTSYLLKS